MSRAACLLLACLAAGPAAAADAPVRIELPALVGVTRGEVLLGEVAAMTTHDLATLQRLVNLPLGPAPHAGDHVRLRRADLVRWISARAGVAGADIRWEGAAEVELQRASGEIPGVQITAAAEAGLRGWLAARSSRAELTSVALARDLPVPLGRSALRVRTIPGETPVARRMTVWVDVWIDDQFLRTVPATFEVAAYAPAYVAASALPAGTRLDSPALEVREAPIAGRAPLLEPAAASGAQQQLLRRPLETGAAVARTGVEDAPGVTRGDWVALRTSAGGIELESRVEALQSGRVGQTVSVKPASATGVLPARVTGPGRVEVLQ